MSYEEKTPGQDTEKPFRFTNGLLKGRRAWKLWIKTRTN